MSKRKIYAASLASHKMENAARSLTDALRIAEGEECYFLSSGKQCPKCKRPLVQLRTVKGNRSLILFCQGCHWFVLTKASGRVKQIPRERTEDRREPWLPPKWENDRPLERSIYRHMRNIRIEE